MTWRSTALLTGATTLAAWLAAPAPPPAGTARRAEAPATRAAQTSEIEAEAARLSERMSPSAGLVPPQRNLFAFGASRPAARPPVVVEAPPVASPAAVPPPPPPPIRLTGIATDVVDGAAVRTAIFSGPDGILFVREGEIAVGLYRVTRIDDDGVEVTRLDDGVSRRITF